MYLDYSSNELISNLSSIPRYWDGRESILDMKNNSFPHWKQMEWIGFYFEYLCSLHLSSIMDLPGPNYGNTGFDGFLEIPWDFKSHAMNSGVNEIIVNDSEAISNAIKDYGVVGLILAMGFVQYDEDGSFKVWHDRQKGKRSQYEFDRIKRGARSRRRKVSFDLQKIMLLKIADSTLIKCGTFQEGFRNADGSPRRVKVKLSLNKIDEEIIYVLNFA